MQIDMSVVLIPLFEVDIPASSESIRLSPEAFRAEANNEVKLREELQPVDLPSIQEFGCCKVLQVLVVGDDINQSCRACKIVASGPKSLVNSKKLLVMGVIVHL